MLRIRYTSTKWSKVNVTERTNRTFHEKEVEERTCKINGVTSRATAIGSARYAGVRARHTFDSQKTRATHTPKDNCKRLSTLRPREE